MTLSNERKTLSHATFSDESIGATCNFLREAVFDMEGNAIFEKYVTAVINKNKPRTVTTRNMVLS